MKVKEKIIRQAIKKIEKELLKIDSVLDATPTPMSDIIALHRKTIEECKKCPPEKAIKICDAAIKKEKELFLLADKKKNERDLINRKVDIEVELGELKSELYYATQ